VYFDFTNHLSMAIAKRTWASCSEGDGGPSSSPRDWVVYRDRMTTDRELATKRVKISTPQREMSSELLEFVLQHEEAFKS
jgi:hypothetical protein